MDAEELVARIMACFFGEDYSAEIPYNHNSISRRHALDEIIADVDAAFKKMGEELEKTRETCLDMNMALDESADALVKSSVNIKDFLKGMSNRHQKESL